MRRTRRAAAAGLAGAIGLVVGGCGAAAPQAVSAPPVAPSAGLPSVTPSSVAPRPALRSSVPPRTLQRADTDVTQYHGDARRTGAYSAATPGALGIGWNTALDGSVYAQPLVIGGLVVAATENDTVYALDAATGAVRWQTHVATPQQASALPCGNIAPTVGITGTPVYDPATKRVYAVAEEAGPKHELIGLDVASGAVATRTPLDLGVAGTAPNAMQQRSALALANGSVYVSFGGRSGDCGAYRGQVIAVPTSGSGALVSYTVPAVREAGAWNPMGPAVDGAGDVYVAIGNGAAGQDPGHENDPYDHSDAVLKLSPTLQLLDFYAPSDWRSQNAVDHDLGSTGPTLLANGLLLAIGKSPAVYVTRQTMLGGIGGQLTRTDICPGFGGTAQFGDVVYLPCTDGTRAVRVAADGTPTVLWHASAGLAGAPVLGGGAVWVVDQSSSDLVEVSATDGHTIAHAHLPTGTTRFATPALSGSRAFVATTGGVVAVSGV